MCNIYKLLEASEPIQLTISHVLDENQAQYALFIHGRSSSWKYE